VKPLFTNIYDEGHEAPKVLAVSWGDGDPKKDAISVVFVDPLGRLLEHHKLDNLMDKNLENEFLKIVDRRRPDLVVIGGFSASTNRLYDRVRQLVLDPDWVKAQEEQGKPIMEEGTFDARDHDKRFPVKYVQDAVARIFQHSKRAEEEFGTLSVTTRYCIGLARYAQSPLGEYAALGQDITAITFDQDAQHLVSVLFSIKIYDTDLCRFPKGNCL
jgi:transcription elongation factor SPT6